MDFVSIVLILVVLYVIASLRVLKQYERGVVFFLGKFAGVRGPGLTLIFVPLQQMTRVSLPCERICTPRLARPAPVIRRTGCFDWRSIA